MKENLNNYIENFNWKDVFVGQSICCTFTKNDYASYYVGEIVEVFVQGNERKIKLKLIENLTNKGLLNKGEIVTASRHDCYLKHKDGMSCSFDASGRVLIPIDRAENIESHPSYGKLSIAKFTGGKNSFYGSDIEHQGGVALKISKSKVERKYGHDFYMSDEIITEIEMSYYQWVEAITSAMNTDGIPCTLKRIGIEYISPAPTFDQRNRFDNKFESEMKRMSNDILKTVEVARTVLSSGKAPNKGEKELILNSLKRLQCDLSSNIPYMAKCFEEKMDEAVLDAKQEIDGFYESMVIKYGKEAIKQLGFTSPQLSIE